MSIHDFFQNLFESSYGGKGRPPELEKNDNFSFNNSHHNHDDDRDDMKHFSSMFDFRVMTDPFEMHQFFQKQINEMMKSFEELPGFQGFGGFESPDVPAITEKQDPRDHYLKPGVKVSPPSGESGNTKSGPTTTWLDKLIPNNSQDNKPVQPYSFSSFKSVIRKTVTLPDGTVKTEEIIRNSDGTEERTESHSKMDGNTTTLFESPIGGLDFLDLFEMPKTPQLMEPRYELLKPGFEKFNPGSEKIDRDLDKQIEEAGIESLPGFTREPGPHTNMNGAFKSFRRRVVTLPNGVIESEEVTRNPDGTEQRTITHTWPDGTIKSVVDPTKESLRTGENNDTLLGRHDKSVLHFALRDFFDTFFK